jgi:hypothetical protein
MGMGRKCAHSVLPGVKTDLPVNRAENQCGGERFLRSLLENDSSFLLGE